MTLLSTVLATATDLGAHALIEAPADKAAPPLSPEIAEAAQPPRSCAAAKPWSRRDHLGKFRLYIPPAKRIGFPGMPDSMNYDSRGWRVTRPDPVSKATKRTVQRLMIQIEPRRFVNQVSALALRIIAKDAPLGEHYVCEDAESAPSPWRSYIPIRLGRVGGPDIAADNDPIDPPAGEWLPGRRRRYAGRYTAPRRWLGVPMSGRALEVPNYPKPEAWMPPYREIVHQEPPSVLGNLWTLSRIAAAWNRSGDPIWQQRAEAWRWWRDFRQPVLGYAVGDPEEDRDPDSTNPKSRPTITEMMRAAGWTGSEKTGWNTRLAEQPMLVHLDDPIPGNRGRTMWRIHIGDLIFGDFVEWGTNKQDKWTAFPKTGLRQFGETKKGRLLRPREDRGVERKPAGTTIDGVKWPRPEYQKRWASELHSYLGLSGAVPYYAEPYQRPINPPATGYGEEEYPRVPVRKEVEDARDLLAAYGVDGSVSLAQARANAGLPSLPDKPEKPHAERHAEFEARLARYQAGENVRLVEPRDLGDAIILGVGADGAVDAKVWRGGVMNPSPNKPARIDFDGWIADKIDRGNSEEESTESPDEIETGGIFLDRLGEQVEILDDAIAAVTAERIARGKGLAPEYAKVEGARMVDRALDNLYALLHPVAEKTRALVADNDNENKEQKIAA